MVNLIATGTVGEYQWLTSFQKPDVFLRLNPNIVLNKFVAVPTRDSGSVQLDEAYIKSGWFYGEGNEVVYHSHFSDLNTLPIIREAEEGWQELYTFSRSVDLGTLHQGNLFENDPQKRKLSRIVNLYGFSLHHSQMKSISDIFWSQLDWIKPDSYLSDGLEHLTFVTREKKLFADALKSLQSSG